MKVNIMSFNTQHCLNYVTREIDYDVMANAIKQCNADIIGLQEMRNEGIKEGYVDQTKILADKGGYPYYYFAEATRFDGTKPYGVALISRFPILSAETIIIPDPEVRKYDGYYETRCILKAKIDVGSGLTVMVSHYGLNPDELDNAIATTFANLPEERAVFMGDLNMEAHTSRIKQFDEKLYNTANKFDEPKFSFRSIDPFAKIDYIYTTKDMTVLEADIPAIVASDHRPHTAVIDVD